MAEWRFARGWSDAELAERLANARHARRNFDVAVEMTPDRGWSRHFSEAAVGREPPGPPQPDGPFQRAWKFIEAYAFSDPRIVRGHFDAASPLGGRVMLIEAQVCGLHYLGPVIVAAERDEQTPDQTVRGFRYETLEGHFERGAEWFLIAKDHLTGLVTFRVHAGWKPGDLPNWWSRVGFTLLVRHYQRAWHRLAHLRLRSLLGARDLEPLPRGSRLVHEGPPLPFTPPPLHATAAGPPPAPIVKEKEAVPTHGMEAS
jgi:uncharacterized protein (UPF0548 family)